jgi:hypothetical protein
MYKFDPVFYGCPQLGSKIILNYLKGLLQGGGISDFAINQSLSGSNTTRYAFRYIYDLLFFMIIKLAFLNIIFGIIIDTFAGLNS